MWQYMVSGGREWVAQSTDPAALGAPKPTGTLAYTLLQRQRLDEALCLGECCGRTWAAVARLGHPTQLQEIPPGDRRLVVQGALEALRDLERSDEDDAGLLSPDTHARLALGKSRTEYRANNVHGAAESGPEDFRRLFSEIALIWRSVAVATGTQFPEEDRLNVSAGKMMDAIAHVFGRRIDWLGYEPQETGMCERFSVRTLLALAWLSAMKGTHVGTLRVCRYPDCRRLFTVSKPGSSRTMCKVCGNPQKAERRRRGEEMKAYRRVYDRYSKRARRGDHSAKEDLQRWMGPAYEDVLLVRKGSLTLEEWRARHDSQQPQGTEEASQHVQEPTQAR